MRRLSLLILLTLALYNCKAQDSTAYVRMLSNVKELVYTDSLHFSLLDTDTIALDTSAVKKYFSAILPNGTGKFKNRTYALLGKITGTRSFDLVVLLEDKRRADSSGISVVYLVSLKRSGEYISNLKVAVNGTKKKSGSGYDISSILYKGNKIIQDSKIRTHDQLYDDVTYYRIISGGRFVLDAKD
jgi:hypothetical protein